MSAEIKDLIVHAVEKSPVEFATAFNELIGQRAVAAVENMRVSVAQAIYSGEEGSTADGEDA